MHLHGLRCSRFLFVRDVALECFARGSNRARITVTFLCLQHVRRGVFARKVLQEVLYHGGGLEQLDKSSARSMGSALRQDQYDCHILSKHVVVSTPFGVSSVERSF